MRSLMISTSVVLLAACTTAAPNPNSGPATFDGASRVGVAEAAQANNLIQTLSVQTNDYFRFKVTPAIESDRTTSQFDCRQSPSGGTDFSSAFSDFYRDLKQREIASSIAVSINAGGGSTTIGSTAAPEIKNEIPVYSLQSKSRGKKCTQQRNRIPYSTPLFPRSQITSKTLSITAVETVNESFDENVVQSAEEAVKSLAATSRYTAIYAAQIGRLASDQLKKLPGRSKDVDTFQLKYEPGKPLQLLIPISRIDTRSGKTIVSANAEIEIVPTILYPSRPGEVPDLSKIAPDEAADWLIGPDKISAAVDKMSSNAWTLFGSRNDLGELDRQCQTMISNLVRNDVSRNDAAAIAWLMVQNHPVKSIALRSANLNCLKSREIELGRFGITLPLPQLPPPEAAEKLLNEGFTDFMDSPPSARRLSAPVIFSDITTTSDENGSLFAQGRFQISKPQPNDVSSIWEVFPHRSQISCVTLPAGRPEGRISKAFAIATSRGKEHVLEVAMAETFEGETPRIESISVQTGDTALQLLNTIQSRWSPLGACRNGLKPSLVFPVQVAALPLPTQAPSTPPTVPVLTAADQ